MNTNNAVNHDDNENKTLSLLLDEYERSARFVSETDNKVVQFLGAGLAVFTLGASYVLASPKNWSIELAWLAPFLFILFLGFVLYLYYNGMANMWTCRVLTARINSMLSEPILIRFDRNLPEGMFFSSRRGSPKVRALYFVLIGGMSALFLFVLISCGKQVYQSSQLAGNLFVLVYGVLIFIELVSLEGIFVDLPSIYNEYIKQMDKLRKMPNSIEFSKFHRTHRQSNMLIKIIPRPWDIFGKSHNYWLGFILAYITLGINPSKIPLIDTLFSNSTRWHSMGDVPDWAIWAYGIVVFFVHEFVLQQAKLLWDDIRDVDRDKKLLHNKGRAIATGAISVKSAVFHVTLRWILAMVLGYALGGLPLTLGFLAISLHQMIYVIWAKPKAQDHPVLVLFTVSFNIALRMLVGVIAVSGEMWPAVLTVILFIALYFQSFGGMSTQWRLEAEYTRKPDGTSSIRPQSNYFMRYGYAIQRYGLILAVIISAAPLIQSYIVDLCGFSLFPASSSWCNAQRWLSNPQLGAVEALLAISIPICLLAALAPKHRDESRRNPISRLLIKIVRRIRGVFGPLLFIAGFVLILLSTIYSRTDLFFFGIGSVNMAFVVTFEGMTYDEWTFENVRKRIPMIKMGWYAYLFKPIEGLGLKELFILTFTDTDIELIKEKSKNNVHS
jgi:hypothetical protein